MTDRNKSKTQLIKKLEKLRKEKEYMLFHLAGPLIEIDLNTRKLTYVNRLASILLGYAAEDLERGIDSADLYTEGDYKKAVEIVRSFIGKSIEKGKEYVHSKIHEYYELSMRRKDGSIVHTEQYGSFVLDNENIPIMLRVSLRDITDRKEAEAARRESEERYHQLVELSPDAITLTDLEGRILAVNLQKLKLSGYDREEELIGKSSFDLIAPEDRDRAIGKLQKTLEQGVVRNMQYNLLRKDGSTYPVELNASLLKDAEGKPLAFIGVMRDISERKEAEKEKAKHMEELEQWKKVTVGRELKMVELKKEINRMKKELAVARKAD